MKLLHIDSSILGNASASRRMTKAIVERLKTEVAPLDVTYRDLAADPLPHLTRTLIASEHPLSAAQSANANEVHEQHKSARVLEEFLAADVVVIGAPMYNFTVPSQLKAWVDRILVPRRTFAYGPEGVTGLAGNKRVIVAITRGGFFGRDSPMHASEHVERYLRTALGFIGITEIQFIVAEGLLVNPAQSEAAMTRALGVVAGLTV